MPTALRDAGCWALLYAVLCLSLSACGGTTAAPRGLGKGSKCRDFLAAAKRERMRVVSDEYRPLGVGTAGIADAVRHVERECNRTPEAVVADVFAVPASYK
jgi:hypothetical protein